MKLIFFLVLVLYAVGIAEAQTTIKIDDVELNPGESTTINLTALGANDLAAFDITIAYDPMVVNVTNVTNNPNFDVEVNNLAYAKDGWVRVASFNIMSPGLNGDVVLSTLTIEAVGNPGDETDLSLTVNTLADSNDNDIPYVLDNGTVRIKIVPTPTPTPTPIPTIYPTLKIDNATANAGETTKVNITALNVTDLANFDITIEYNPSVVIVTNAENNPAFGTPINNLDYASEGWVRIASLNLGEGKSGDVLISTLTLQALGNPGEKSYLNLTVNTFVNSTKGEIKVRVENGTFIIAVAGDFNGNGRVDIGDVTYVAYMVVGKVPINMEADFNGNGRVDIGDAAKIAYYVVGKVDSL